MPDDKLFPVGDAPPPVALPRGVPRVQAPLRNQVEYYIGDLDSLIPDDHQARVVWDFVQEVDVVPLYQPIEAFEGCAGRTPIDPRILLALWLYATLRAVGSARELERLCSDHVAFRWLCGGVSVNYHTLADFRSGSAALLDVILRDSIAALLAANLVTLDRVAHDGLRVRSDAATKSFRGKESLEELRKVAEAQIQNLRWELEDDPAAGSRRQRAARTRAKAERLERIEKALEFYPEAAARKKDKTKKARVSITDPESPIMKMPNGGFNPAYNIQISAATQSQIIVGVGVSSCGSDHALAVPAADQIKKHSGDYPGELLIDGGFGKPESVKTLATAPYEIVVYAPPTEYKNKDGTVKEPKAGEALEIEAWRKRMETEEAKAIYPERASTIECVNALARNRGLQQLPVRGMEKVKAVVLLFALAHNLARAESLKKEASLKKAVKAQTG